MTLAFVANETVSYGEKKCPETSTLKISRTILLTAMKIEETRCLLEPEKPMNYQEPVWSSEWIISTTFIYYFNIRKMPIRYYVKGPLKGNKKMYNFVQMISKLFSGKGGLISEICYLGSNFPKLVAQSLPWI